MILDIGHRRVLVVDDEVKNRRLLEVILESEGLIPEFAASGEEALRMVEQAPPDIILLDVMMPGMDGYEVVRRLKANESGKNIPVIMITALDDREAKIAALNAGAEEFLTKPVDRVDLCLRVRNLLRLKAYGEHFDRYSRVLEGEVSSRAAELDESDKLYHSTFDMVPVGIVYISLDGRWLKVNQRLCDLLGYSKAELEVTDTDRLLCSSKSPSETQALRNMIAGIADLHTMEEKTYKARNGSTLYTRVNISLHRDKDDDARHFIYLIEDFTARRALENQLQQANKMNAVGRLAAGVAHDFNNLLTVILGQAELMRQDIEESSLQSADLGEIIKAAQSAAGLTSQLLAFSRQQRLDPQPVDLNRVIESMTGMLSRLIGENIEVELKLMPSLTPAIADLGQLEQVIMNLVINAKDAMPEGGKLLITTNNVVLGGCQVDGESIAAGPYVTLSVTDTGHGMSPETLAGIFEPFFTTKETGKGTGLGLSTTYGIVRQSKGFILVQSVVGVGTTFEVHLPTSNALRKPVEAEVLSSTPPTRPPSETVLLVEDEPGVRRLAKKILTRAGYHVLQAPDGTEAERQFLLHSDSINMVITDVIMPLCGGVELVDRLRARFPTLRVLYISGYSDVSLSLRLNSSDIRFLQKPFTTSDLLQQVRELLEH